MDAHNYIGGFWGDDAHLNWIESVNAYVNCFVSESFSNMSELYTPQNQRKKIRNCFA